MYSKVDFFPDSDCKDLSYNMSYHNGSIDEAKTWNEHYKCIKDRCGVIATPIDHAKYGINH